VLILAGSEKLVLPVVVYGFVLSKGGRVSDKFTRAIISQE